MKIRLRPGIAMSLAIVCLLPISLLTSMPHISAGKSESVALIPQQPTTPSLFKEYNVTTSQAGPEAIIWGGNNNFWFTEFNGSKIGELFTNGTMVDYPIPNETRAEPAALAIDHQGRIWFADQKPPGSIWEFVPSLGTKGFKQYATPSSNSFPIFIVIDSSDNVWFTEGLTSRIGMFPHNGSSSQNITEFVTPTSGSPGSGPDGMVLQNGTSFLWITEFYANKIARFDIRTDRFQEYTPSVSLTIPVGLVVDANGNLWISEHGGSAVAEFTPSSLTWKKYPTSTTDVYPTGPATLAIDGLGRLWFVEHYANRVGRLDPISGTLDEFVIPTAGKAYSLLNALDPQNNFWFTEFDANQIGMIQHNSTSPARITHVSSSTASLTSGQTATAGFSISNIYNSQITLSLGITSSFSPQGQTTGSEISLSTYSLTLNPGENKTVIATITPDFSLVTGVYAAGIVATDGGISSVGTFFLQVQASLWYQLETIIPVILAVAAVVIAVAFLVTRRRKTALRANTRKSVPKLSVAVSLAMLFFFLIQQTGESWAKCPGQLGFNPNGSGPDYYGIALDVGSIAFFGLVAYLLIRDRLRRGRATEGNPGESPQDPGS